MSESDDSDIQADIQALTEALSLPAASNPQQQLVSSNDSRSGISSIDFEENDDEYFNYIYANEDNESLNAYEMNAKLITGLLIAKEKLTVLLQECETKIKELDEKMSSNEASSLHITNRISITNAGMPYFKDKNHFRAPKNYDTKLKESSGELFLQSLKKPSRWSEKDREILLKAIRNEAIESVLSKGFNNEIDKQFDKETLNDQTKKIASTLPRNFREMVGAIGEREFDWHKISRIDFENKHSPGECQAMWNIYLHPDFNKSEWTNAEDNKLLQFAKECKYQDWDTITQFLGTNRSAYQCFIRYNTIKTMLSSGRAWTKEEDQCLANIINNLSIGDYIPWSEVANHMRHKTKQQIYARWMYRKAPHLRKGRFTYMETKTLLNAVEKYGTDFSKISNIVMPYRTSIQLHGRYHTIMTNMNNSNIWTIDDDKRLLQLHKNHNNDWSKIATYFSNKSRVQVRHRFNAIQKYIKKKNICLENIPRPSNNNEQFSIKKYKELLSKNILKQSNKDASVEKRIIHIEDIQLRLYESLSLPFLETINSEKSYNSEQLVYDTKRLHDTLDLLNANLDFSSFQKNMHLNRREKRLLASLKEYINIRNNKIQNHEQIEKYRMQMFGHVEKVSKNSFIPPLPFDGYIRTKKVKNKNQSIDCELNVNQKFLINVPTEFSINPYIHFFINIEEEIQFQKFSQLLISDYHKCDEQRVNLYKLLECYLIFDKANSSEYDNSKDVYSKLINYKERKSLNKLQMLIKTEYTNNEDNEEKLFSDIIMPNRATLLGIKNLLLWKLLYEYQNKSEHCELLLKSEQQETKQTMTNCFIQMESSEYQLLRTRLLQLFKLPIGLSHTILKLPGPEPIFLTEKKNQKTISKKRKFEDINSVELSENKHNYNLANSSSNFDSNIETADFPIIRSCNVVYKKFKILPK